MPPAFRLPRKTRQSGIVIEAVDDLAALRGGAGERDVARRRAPQVALHQLDHPEELGEDHHLLAAVQRLLEELLVEVPLARGELVRLVERRPRRAPGWSQICFRRLSRAKTWM